MPTSSPIQLRVHGRMRFRVPSTFRRPSILSEQLCWVLLGPGKTLSCLKVPPSPSAGSTRKDGRKITLDLPLAGGHLSTCSTVYSLSNANSFVSSDYTAVRGHRDARDCLASQSSVVRFRWLLCRLDLSAGQRHRLEASNMSLAAHPMLLHLIDIFIMMSHYL